MMPRWNYCGPQAAVSKPACHVPRRRDQFPPARVLPDTGFARNTVTDGYTRQVHTFKTTSSTSIHRVLRRIPVGWVRLGAVMTPS
jgi:hypothetical protein